jgi:hypothetical protein
MFCGLAGHLDEFCFWCKRIEKRRFEYARYSIKMSSLICRLVFILVFHLACTLVLRLTLFHVLCLISPMDLSMAHMVLVHERTALSLDALVMAHVLVVVIVSRIGSVFLLEGPTPTLSRDTWKVHVFPVVDHIPLDQVVRCKGL